MVVLITGSAGMMGCNFSRYLLKKGYTVVGIDNFSGGKEDFLPVHSRFTNYSFTINKENLCLLYNVFETHKPHICFHFAASAHECLSPFNRCANYENNTVASAAVVNSCIKYRTKIVFASSIAIYGYGNLRGDRSGFSEKDLPILPDPYGISKYATELDIQHAHLQFGLDYTIFRPHNVVSEYQSFYDRYRNVVAIFIRKIINGEPLQIYGDGNQTRCFSDMSCLCSIFEHSIYDFNGRTFNVGSDTETTINELADITLDVGKEFGFDGSIQYVEKRNEVKHAKSNHQQILDLGFRDATDLRILIRKLFSWIMVQKKYPVKEIDYEIEDGIYSFWKKQ